MIDERIAAADPAADVPDPSIDECRRAIDAIYAGAARSRAQRRLRRVLTVTCLLGAAVAAGLTLAPRGDDPALPGAVRAFADALTTQDGVLHMATRSRWIEPLDSVPRSAMADRDSESWTMLDGSRWRDRTTIAGEDGPIESAGRGRRTPPPHAAWSLLLIRQRRLRVAGETSIEGRAAYVVIPDNLRDVRLYVRREDGRLMRIDERPGNGLFRTDVTTSDVLPDTPENRALTRPRR